MEQVNGIEAIIERLQNFKIDSEGIAEQVIDDDKVQWYKERFDRAIEDKCPEAISAYLQRLNRDDANEITRVVIMHDALNR